MPAKPTKPARRRLVRPPPLEVYVEKQRLTTVKATAWKDMESLKVMFGPLVKAIADNEMDAATVPFATLWHETDYLGLVRSPDDAQAVDCLFAARDVPRLYDWHVYTSGDEDGDYHDLSMYIFTWDGAVWAKGDRTGGSLPEGYLGEWLTAHEEEFHTLWAPLPEASAAEISAQALREAAPRQFWLVRTRGVPQAWTYHETIHHRPLIPEDFYEGMPIRLAGRWGEANLRATFVRPTNVPVAALQPYWSVEDMTNPGVPRLIPVRPAEASGTQGLPDFNAVRRDSAALATQEDDQPF